MQKVAWVSWFMSEGSQHKIHEEVIEKSMEKKLEENTNFFMYRQHSY